MEPRQDRVKVRQGVTGHGVRYVLIISFALAFVVLAGLFIAYA